MLREEFLDGQFAFIETCREFIDISIVATTFPISLNVYFDMQNLQKRTINVSRTINQANFL